MQVDLPVINSNDHRVPEQPGEAVEVAVAIKSSTTSLTSSIVDSPILEIGGPKGLEPTRFGDWERNGRCIDF
ncbi:MAG: DUF1674 domain-containing protein [Gammaproteobacteria bacterium]|nr:DUF1674 domain-containing protein [Gammaproteobacteria bacterium]